MPAVKSIYIYIYKKKGCVAVTVELGYYFDIFN